MNVYSVPLGVFCSLIYVERNHGMADGKKQIDMPPDREHLDFLTAIILLIVSVAAIILSLGYWRDLGGEFYASPGFMPTIIAAFLIVMAVTLLLQSVKGSSVAERCRQLGAALPRTLRSRTFWRAVIGLAIFAVYIFGMLGRLPFWLASFLVLFAILLYLNLEGKVQLKPVLKLLLIAVLSVAGIVLLFQVAFSVPMP